MDDATIAGLIGVAVGGVFTLGSTWLGAGLSSRQSDHARRLGVADHVARELARVDSELRKAWKEDDSPQSTRAKINELIQELLTLRVTHLYGPRESELSLRIAEVGIAADPLVDRGPEWIDDWDDHDDDLMRNLFGGFTDVREELGYYTATGLYRLWRSARGSLRLRHRRPRQKYRMLEIPPIEQKP